MRFSTTWLNKERPAPAARRRRATSALRTAGGCPLVEALEGRCLLTTLTVTSLGDSGAGSLRASIAAADSGDIIVFSPKLFSSTESSSPPKKGQQTGDPTITLKNSQLTLTKDLTIQGPGADKLTIRTGSGAFRVFEVALGATVTLSGMTITNGWSRFGGGIYNGGTLTLADSSIRGNRAQDGGGIYNAGGRLLTIINSKVTGNHAERGYAGSGHGGGIYNSPGGTVTLSSNSQVFNNTAVTYWEFGGAFANDTVNYGTAYVDNTSSYGILGGNAPILI